MLMDLTLELNGASWPLSRCLTKAGIMAWQATISVHLICYVPNVLLIAGYFEVSVTLVKTNSKPTLLRKAEYALGMYERDII